MLFSSVAHAQDCPSIDNDIERLNCFDKTYPSVDKKELPSTKALSAPKSTYNLNTWVHKREKDKMNDSFTNTIAIYASTGLNNYGKKIPLIIQCYKKKAWGKLKPFTSLYVDWGNYLGQNAKVTTRIGSNKPKTSSWTVSNDGVVSFYLGNDVKFINSLLADDILTLKVTPYSQNPVTASFDISGLGEAIKPIRQACKW